MSVGTTQLPVPQHYSLRRTLSLLRMGHSDPSLQLAEDGATICFTTEAGTVCVQAKHLDHQLFVEWVGEAAAWIEPKLPGLFGLDDDPSAFQPSGKMKQLTDRLRGTHLPYLPVVFHRLVQIVLLQLVSWADGFRAWRLLVERYGVASPGGFALRCPPSPERLKQLAYYDLVDCGILPKQARLILRLAAEAQRIERLAESPGSLAEFLYSVRGIGNWTVQYLLGSALGQPDALLTGDYNMPHTVAWYLAGEARGNDQRMMELLEPFQGHRFRVVNLLWQSGIRAPRRGHRMPTNRWRFTGR